MALTVDWTTPSSTAISSCVLLSSRSALTLAIRRSSTILDLGIVKLPVQHRSAALIATGWLCQEDLPLDRHQTGRGKPRSRVAFIFSDA